jgi:hypothetical protein
MSRDALKFTDLNTFLSLTEELRLDGRVTDLLYEGGKLPYCSAFFIPLDLLPESFDYTKLSLFGGTITKIDPIRYLGTERFTTDFMIYPLSLRGYVEVQTAGYTTFDQTNPFDDPEGTDMNFVINIEDGGGKEFFLAQNGNLVSLLDTDQEPQIFKTAKQVDKQMDLLRQKYSEACQVYGLEYAEFEARRKQLNAQ